MHHTHSTHSGGYEQRSAGGQQGHQSQPGQVQGQGRGQEQPQPGQGPSQPGQQGLGGQPGGQQQFGGAAPGQQQPGQSSQRQSPGPVGREFRTRNYLPDEARRTSVAVLNGVLADVTVLETHLKAAHWNVKGPHFYQLHELFEDVAEMLDGYADEVAERATALGGEALGTARDAARTSNVPPWPPDTYDGQAVLQHVADHLAALDAELYRAITTTSQRDDLDTADLLNEFSRDVSKALWFVEAHLQGGGQGRSPARGRGQPQSHGHGGNHDHGQSHSHGQPHSPEQRHGQGGDRPAVHGGIGQPGTGGGV